MVTLQLCTAVSYAAVIDGPDVCPPPQRRPDSRVPHTLSYVSGKSKELAAERHRAALVRL